MTVNADWFFDYISPFAYLQCVQLAREPLDCEINPHPILFAALLNHYGHKGPAEIAPKRFHTYRQVVWEARRLGIPLNMPAAHPFNPLPLLRATFAAGCTWSFVRDAFAFVWVDGKLPQDNAALAALLARHSVDPVAAADAEIKAQLRRSTEAAIDRGVFGVPTLALGDELYWGADHTPMVRERLRGADWFASLEVEQLKALPEAATRK